MRVRASLQDHGRTLVITRFIPAEIDVVWAHIAESDLLSGWFGTWSGDPSSGCVAVTMNAEAEAGTPVPYEILACDPPRLLTVAALEGFAQWRIGLMLAEAADGTSVELRQEDVNRDEVAMIGPGWEWYLDRLLASTVGDEPPSLGDFETTYMAMSADYEALTR